MNRQEEHAEAIEDAIDEAQVLAKNFKKEEKAPEPSHVKTIDH
jgi:hypothetical protein